MNLESETQLVLVETISQCRNRYVVEVPVGIDDFGNDKSLWALDTVTCEEAEEFSQKHVGETILSHRIIDKKEALRLFDEDNEYAKSWTKEHKIKTFVTKWVDND